MTRAERVFRVLLRAYPAHTREASGDDMVQLFADRLRDAGSSRAKAGVWLEAVADIARTAPAERLARRRALAVAEGPALGFRPLAPDVRVASLPLALAAIVLVARPGFLDPLFDASISLLGVPLGLGVLVLSAIVAAAGILAARRSDDLRDPAVQVLLLGVVLVPVPMLVLSTGPAQAGAYAAVMTMVVVAARFRALMLALAIPFVVWLLVGPAVVVSLLSDLPSD